MKLKIISLLIILGIVFFFLNDVEEIKEEKFECEPGSRLAEACIALYQPVCGWNDDTIKCFAYPCASTYGNSCEACQNKNVEYYTDGECPKP